MERLTKHVKNEKDDYTCIQECEKGCVHGWLKSEAGCRCEKFGELLVRLCQIEDIFGDTYDLDRLREAIDKKDEYERFIKQWEQMAEIAGAVKKVGAERVAELVEADKQGRCVVLPCKYGERVYCVYHKRETHFGCAHCLASYGMGVACDYYNAETDTCSNSPEKYKNYEIISKHFEAGMIPDFGKTVFKSSKDAESACKRLEKEMDRPNEI